MLVYRPATPLTKIVIIRKQKPLYLSFHAHVLYSASSGREHTQSFVHAPVLWQVKLVTVIEPPLSHGAGSANLR